MSQGPGPPSPVSVVALATTLAAVGVMPAFLLGATALFVRPDLGFNQAQLGLAVSMTFVASGISSLVGGRLTEHLGVRRSLRAGALCSVLGMAGIATLARSWSHLIVLLVIGGLGNGILQPATNLALYRGVTARRGLSFGIKQSGGSAATFLAGATVPLIALTIGWRWAFAGGAAIAMAAGLLVPRGLADNERKPRRGKARLREGDAATGPLVVLSIASGLGAGAATALGAFLVESAVAGGMRVATAGWLLAACSISGILARLTAGWVTDARHGGELLGIAGMLTVGGLGFAMLAIGGPLATLIGGLVAFSCGWGWVGLLMHTIVRLNPHAPAAATGIVQPGTAAGAALGPLAVGSVVESMSFSVAWGAAAVAAWASALLVVVSRQWFISSSKRSLDDVERIP